MRHPISIRRRQRIVAVLDIGTSKVGCVIAKATPVSGADGDDAESMRFDILGLGHHRAEGVKSGLVVQLDAAEHCIRSAVDEAERMAGVTVEDVIVAVSCGRLKGETFAASVALPNGTVQEDDIARILAGACDYAGRDSRVVLHALPVSYGLDGNSGIRDPLGMCGERLVIDVHAVTADDVAMRNLMLCVERCHLNVLRLVAAPYASALSVLTPDEVKLGAAVIDFGAGTTTLAVFSEGQLIHVEAIAMGAYGLTRDIARTLSTPIEHAERLKTLHGSAFATASDEREIITYPSVGEPDSHTLNQITKAQLAVIIRPRIEEILDQMRRRLAANGHAAEASQHLVLTGGGSQLTGLPELSSNMFGRPVRLGRPRKFLNSSEAGKGPDFSVATGLLLQWARDDDRHSGRREQRYLGTGTGYFARVSEWIRDNF